MNLNSVAASVVSAILPQVKCLLLISQGDKSIPGGNRIPVYSYQPNIQCSIQASAGTSLQQVDSTSQQGDYRDVYMNGNFDGILRVEGKGGNLLATPDGKLWLVAQVLEPWDGIWTKVLVVLQNEKRY